jgi:predicted phosphodiesterase
MIPADHPDDARPTSREGVASGRSFRPLLRAVLAILLAQAMGFAFLFGWSSAAYPIGPVDVSVLLRPAWRGETRVALPPLGRVSARTHQAPIAIELTPSQLHLRSVQDLLKKLDNQRATVAQVQRDARRAVEREAARLALLALVGGALGSLTVGRRRWRQVAGSGLLCVALVAGLGAWAGLTFNRKAFESPRYTGVLSEAPVAVEMVRRGFSDLGRIRTQLRNTATNLAATYGQFTALAGGPGDESLRILHVSDLHNNPAGVDLALALARSYHVHAVICTGDFTDFGTPMENRLLASWRSLTMPRFFISGNHDSQTTIRAIDALPGVTLLADGQVTDLLGLRVIGWNDPVSRRPGLGDAEVTAAELDALGSTMKTTLGQLSPRPDLVLVHNYRAAVACAGLAPVFLFGHDHRARIWQAAEGSWMIDAGTTGASGIRNFTTSANSPYSAALLYFARPPAARLQAIDLMQLREPGGGFTVERTTVPLPPAQAGSRTTEAQNG